MSHVIAGGTVLAGPEFEVLDPGYLVIEKGRIAEVAAGRAPDHAGPVLDARGTIVAPAFINGHTHVSDSIVKDVGFGQDYFDLVMPPDGVRFRALRDTPAPALEAAIGDTLDYMIAGGISTFVDFREGGLAGVRLLRRTAAERPIRALAMGRFASFPPQPADALERNEGALDGAALREVGEVLAEADGFSLVSANDLTDEGLRQLGDAVRSHRRLMGVHVADSDRIKALSVARTGVSDVDRILRYLRPDFVVHLTVATEAELDRLAAAGARAVACPRLYGAIGVGVPRFDLMLERGMLVALGTDNVMLASASILREVDYASRAVRGLRRDPAFPTARQMLQMITINPARIFGYADDLGSIERGKLADLVLFDARSLNLRPVHDPVAAIVNRAEPRDIRAVFHEGRLAYGALA